MANATEDFGKRFLWTLYVGNDNTVHSVTATHLPLFDGEMAELTLFTLDEIIELNDLLHKQRRVIDKELSESQSEQSSWEILTKHGKSIREQIITKRKSSAVEE